MQLQYWHRAASSSPMYGGGPRWGTNDLAFKRTEVGDKRLPIKIFTLRHSAVGNHNYPKYFRLQQGGKRIYPDELTDVSDSVG